MSTTKSKPREVVAVMPLFVLDRFISPHLRLDESDPLVVARPELFRPAGPRSGVLTTILGYTNATGDLHRGDRVAADDPRVHGHEAAFVDVGDERLSEAELAGLSGMLRHNSAAGVEQRARLRAERAERDRLAKERRAQAIDMEAGELEERARRLREGAHR